MPVHDWIPRITSISLISSHSSRCERWFWGCFFSEVHPYLQNPFSVFGWLELANSICQKNTPHFEPHFLNLQCAAGWNAVQQAPPPPPQRKTRSLDTSFFSIVGGNLATRLHLPLFLFRPGTTRPGRCQCTIVRWVAKTLRKAGYKKFIFLGVSSEKIQVGWVTKVNARILV